MTTRKQKAWVNNLLNNIALETSGTHEQAVLVHKVIRRLIKVAAGLEILSTKETTE